MKEERKQKEIRAVVQRSIRHLQSDLLAIGAGEVTGITVIARNPKNDDQIVTETNEEHLADPMSALLKSLKK